MTRFQIKRSQMANSLHLGPWYAVQVGSNGLYYLHADGTVRYQCQPSAWYATRSKAREAVALYRRLNAIVS